eukprot:10966253-Lingulodinium_polyedra.AAC.1
MCRLWPFSPPCSSSKGPGSLLTRRPPTAASQAWRVPSSASFGPVVIASHQGLLYSPIEYAPGSVGRGRADGLIAWPDDGVHVGGRIVDGAIVVHWPRPEL